mgnify:CR=1 FL=1
MNSMKNLFDQLGTLRVSLVGVMFFLTILSPFALKTTVYEGWGLFSTVIVPALVPIFFFVALLDVLMSAVFKSSVAGEAQARYRLIIRTELVALAIMTIAWFPLFWGVLNPD